MCSLCFDSKVPTWDEVKQLFADTNKLKQIIDEYDTSRTTPIMKEKSKEYGGRPEFTVEFITGLSVAAGQLWEWVLEVYSTF